VIVWYQRDATNQLKYFQHTNVPGNGYTTWYHICHKQACTVHTEPETDPLDRYQTQFSISQIHSHKQAHLWRWWQHPEYKPPHFLWCQLGLRYNKLKIYHSYLISMASSAVSWSSKKQTSLHYLHIWWPLMLPKKFCGNVPYSQS
jgi:hypothetical protein